MEESPWERPGRILFAALLVAICPLAIRRTIHHGGSDFPEFYAAGRYVLEHGVRQPGTILSYYWPSLDVAWAGLAWLPLPLAACIWYAVGCWSWVALLGATSRYLLPEADEKLRRESALAAGLLVMPLALDHLCLGAFHIVMLWLMVAGLGRISRGRSWSGGLLLGLAVWIKLLPIMAVGYLALKRKWAAAVLAVACALTVDAVLSVGALGPQAAWKEHQKWWRHDAVGTTHRLLVSPAPVAETRCSNQSLAAVLRRVLTDVVVYEPDGTCQRMNLAYLSAFQLKATYAALLGLLLLGVVAVCRRAGPATSLRQWSTEIALVTLATLWFSPVVWSYHHTAVTPGLVLVLSHGPRHKRLVWLVVLLWVLASCLLGWQLARGFGAMLWMSWFLAAVLIWTSRLRPADPDSPQPEVGPSA